MLKISCDVPAASGGSVVYEPVKLAISRGGTAHRAGQSAFCLSLVLKRNKIEWISFDVIDWKNTPRHQKLGTIFAIVDSLTLKNQPS